MKVLSYIISPEFVYMWIRVATPIIFSSLGGVICSRAGVVNLGLEGIMLISEAACSGGWWLVWRQPWQSVRCLRISIWY